MFSARVSTSLSKSLGSCIKKHRRTYATSGRPLLPSYSRSTKSNPTIQQTRYSSNTNNNNQSTFSRLKSNGTPEILIGSTILLIAGVDYTLQQRQNADRSNMMKHLQSQVDIDAQRSLSTNTKTMADKEILFQCIVRRIPMNFDGHKCLTELEVGDVLDVVEEGVGPGGVYNLCIKRDNKDEGLDRIGWFPCSCLEVVKTEQKSEN